MEKNETLEEAAMRETKEEANAAIALTALYTVMSIPHVSQVYMVFRGTMKEKEFWAGEESLDVQLFDLKNIPWTKLAFQVIGETLRHYCQDRVTRYFPIHVGTIQQSQETVNEVVE